MFVAYTERQSMMIALHFDLWDQRKQCASICHMAQFRAWPVPYGRYWHRVAVICGWHSVNVIKTFATTRPYKDATNQLWHSTRAHNGIYWLSSAVCPRGLRLRHYWANICHVALVPACVTTITYLWGKYIRAQGSNTKTCYTVIKEMGIYYIVSYDIT